MFLGCVVTVHIFDSFGENAATLAMSHMLTGMSHVINMTQNAVGLCLKAVWWCQVDCNILAD